MSDLDYDDKIRGRRFAMRWARSPVHRWGGSDGTFPRAPCWL